MATAAYAVPGTETPAPDAMDLRSDTGWDLGGADVDVDVEFDFDPAPAADGNDDDVSIHDAATDNGADPQTVQADQDDYMVDDGANEEHELDYDYEQDAHTSITDQPSAVQPQTAVLPDNELLEYEDEEEEGEGDTPVVNEQGVEQQHQEPIQYQEPADTENDHGDDYEAQSTVNSAVDESAAQHQDETYDQEVQDEFQGQYEYGSGIADEHVDDSHYHDDAEDHADENGGVALEDQESYTFAEEQDENSHDTMSLDIQPVTVNFLGDEFWLFKEHDTDASGDWLLEDPAIVEGSLGEFFTACRKALGDDVLPEQELGLRFDSLHGLEMFEDNTACVAVSLQHLLRIYYNLHEQDGNQEPESFYITLLPRPRFATLLADLLKHVDKGSGYSGFTAAVAANETHFPNANSGHTTDNAAWGTDDDGEVVGQAESTSESEYDGDHATPQEHDPVQNIGEHENEGVGDTDETKVDQGSTYAEDAQVTHSADESSDSPGQGDDDSGERASNSDEINATHVQVPSEVAQDTLTTPPFGEDDDDYLKYDDEYENAPPARSPSSSTLNADDVAVDDGDSVSPLAQLNTTNTAVGDNALSVPDNDHVEYDDASIDPGNQLGDSNEANATTSAQSSNIAATDLNAQDEQISTADNILFDLQATGTDNAGLHFDSTDLGQYANNSIEEVEIDFDTTKDPDDTFSVHDDDGEDVQEAEGNAFDYSPAIASSAAEHAAPSSTDLLNNSSQGLKRTIDQTDDLGSDVTESADIKRPRM